MAPKKTHNDDDNKPIFGHSYLICLITSIKRLSGYLCVSTLHAKKNEFIIIILYIIHYKF